MHHRNLVFPPNPYDFKTTLAALRVVASLPDTFTLQQLSVLCEDEASRFYGGSGSIVRGLVLHVVGDRLSN